MQEDLSIPEERRISLRAVAVDEQATRDSKAPLQVGLVVIGAGLFGTIMAAGMIDGFMLRRQRDADGGDVIPTADPGAGLPPTTAPADQDVRASASRDWPFAPQVSGLIEVSPQSRSAEVDHDLETQRQ
jgi:hypothetical protein